MEYGKRVLLEQYKNGNKLWGTVTKCYKCGGFGKLGWINFADSICFDCNGKGWYYSKEREYSPKEAAKREKRLAKEREVWEACVAAEAEREAKRREEEARKEAERLAEIERNRGQFIGTEGDKIKMEVTLTKTFSFERPSFNAPWKMDYVTGYIFKTDDGNTLVWMTTGDLCRKEYREDGNLCDNRGRYEPVSPDEGERLTISAVIKGHKEYDNVNQTVLNRVKWIK